MQEIRSKTVLEKNKALFMFYDNILICPSEIVGVLYDNYKSKHNFDKKENIDKFFYINIK